MSYIEQSLIPGERVLYKARLHWIALGWRALLGLCLGLGGAALLVVAAVTAVRKSGYSPLYIWAGFLLIGVAAALIGVALVKRNATEIAVTNKRVLIKTGIVQRHTVEVLLSKIESIGVSESFPGRVLGFGTVIVRGTGGTPETFDRIASPLEFRRQVQGQIEGLRA